MQNDFKMSMTVEKENRDILSEQTKESDDQANSGMILSPLNYTVICVTSMTINYFNHFMQV